MDFVSSKRRKPKRIAVHGKPGSGKTTLAATLSEFCPEVLPAPQWTKLEDIIWVPFDTNATDALTDVKLEVDEVPVNEIINSFDKIGDVMRCIDDAVMAAHERGYKTVVFDTVTKLDKMMLAWWDANGPRTKSGGRDSFAIWRSVTAMHQRFHENSDLLDMNVITLLHTKPVSQSDSGVQKNKVGATAGSIIDSRFDFMYEDTVNVYRRDTSHIFVTDCQKKGKEYVYQIHDDSYNGFEAKSRFRNSLPKGPHKAHLRALFNQQEEK